MTSVRLTLNHPEEPDSRLLACGGGGGGDLAGFFGYAPRGAFPWEERVKNEGLSREVAQRIVDAFAAAGLAVHPFKPVRDKIIRERRQWVPAVLRYNQVPAKALLEVCNLANDEDRRLLQTRAFRQRVAEAIVRGLLAYYGEKPDMLSPQVVAGAK